MCTLSGGSRLTAVVVYQKNDGFKFEMALNMHDLSIQEAVIDFKQVSKLANNSDDELNIFIETLSAPHRAPSNLPSGKMAVYMFFFKDQCLKVGKACQRSAARYTSQHYNINGAPSTLAASIARDSLFLQSNMIDVASLSTWIKENTCRYNLLLEPVMDQALVHHLCSALDPVQSCHA